MAHDVEDVHVLQFRIFIPYSVYQFLSSVNVFKNFFLIYGAPRSLELVECSILFLKGFACIVGNRFGCQRLSVCPDI